MLTYRYEVGGSMVYLFRGDKRFICSIDYPSAFIAFSRTKYGQRLNLNSSTPQFESGGLKWIFLTFRFVGVSVRLR